MIWVAVFLFTLYFLTICALVAGAMREKRFIPRKGRPSTSFSIIIPFRDEAAHLPNLLNSLVKLKYPTELYEILLVNDASSDLSVLLVEEFIKTHTSCNIQVIENKRNSASPKKDALETAIQTSLGDWILTTDADCVVHPAWLSTLDNFIMTSPCHLVVMPVAIAKTASPTFLQAYEQLDFLSLMGATVGGFGIHLPFLCNGANLAFEKAYFLQNDGYATHNHIASGDDHFLLENMVTSGAARVCYLKSSSVLSTTQPQSTWKGFINQRIRWAAKATSYSFWFSKYAGLLVLAVNILWSLLFVYGIISILFSLHHEVQGYAFAKAYVLAILVSKALIDLILIASQTHFYNRYSYLIYYPLVSICYPFISSYIALKALMSGFEWKGRQYRR